MYSLEVRHSGLNKYRQITGKDPLVVEQKAAAQAAQWETLWQRKQEKQIKIDHLVNRQERAEELTRKATEEQQAAEAFLAATLHVHNAVDWDSLLDKSHFLEPQPEREAVPNFGTNSPADFPHLYEVTKDLLDYLLSSRYEKKVAVAQRRLATHIDVYEQREADYARRFEAWRKRRAEHAAAKAQRNAAIERDRVAYMKGDADAISDYYDLVFTQSSYPDWVPQDAAVKFSPESRTLLVQFVLPSPSDIPTVREVKYIKTRDEFKESFISKKQTDHLYDSVIYQICLRTLHEVFKADVIGAVEAAAFNGIVHTVDPATGQKVKPCIVSLHVKKEEFEGMDLGRVDPKACFRKLKGVGSSRLSAVAPVTPVIEFDMSTQRFVEGYDVAGAITEDVNLAAMDWEDFEHLVRQVFENEFSTNGGEVKVTQASRDGGIDAVAFDPDPIRGGKIVIQAKRYTRTVNVSAVRDLYGTLQSEGANKGILVTTADFGPDAYAFAKGKPITLLNGGNLLHLLQKHGTKASIDTDAARKSLGLRSEDGKGTQDRKGTGQKGDIVAL